MYTEMFRLCTVNRAAVLALAVLLVFSLSGCAKPAPTPVDAEVSFSEADQVDIAPVLDAELKTDLDVVTEFCEHFATAYFNHDREALKSMLVSNYEYEIEFYEDGAAPDKLEDIKGAGNVVDGLPCVVSVEFFSEPDRLSCLSIQLVKDGDSCTVVWYGLEG